MEKCLLSSSMVYSQALSVSMTSRRVGGETARAMHSTFRASCSVRKCEDAVLRRKYFAVAQSASARGKTRLRLDCHAGNAWLCRYYERHGFCLAGTVQQHSNYQGNLYEMPL